MFVQVATVVLVQLPTVVAMVEGDMVEVVESVPVKIVPATLTVQEDRFLVRTALRILSRTLIRQLVVRNF